MTKTKSTHRLTAQRKLELYRTTRAPDAPVGELLREYGLHLDDLREIEQTVESAALAELSVAFTVLEKKEREESQRVSPASRSRRRRAR